MDPSVELVSLLFRLAGNPEYSHCRVPAYAADVDIQFNRFRDHSAVQLARKLRQTRGVSYDACMSLAVLLTDSFDPRLSVPLDPWPDFLDQRWDAASVNTFVTAAGQFVKDSGFNDFIKAHESLYRTSESRMRYLSRYEGEQAAKREIREQQALGFEWMQELSGLLRQYEAERDHYPTLESFSLRVVSFFRDYAGQFQKKHSELAASRPKVVSIAPANGAADIDPGTRIIQVVFDRPMRDGSWSMCGGGPKFPEPTDKPNYDESRTTWTVKVNLKPDWDYEFWLNSGQYQGFQSEAGVPLKSVHVTFRTGSTAPHH